MRATVAGMAASHKANSHKANSHKVISHNARDLSEAV
jgi:hypothetical protein